MENRQKKFDYKWVIILLSALMVCVVLGFCSSTKSLYVKAITDALGISRSTFSVNDSCRFVTTAVINLFFGALVARFGAKKLIGAGFICLIASCLIYCYATNVYVFYIGGVLLGLGLSWTTTTMVGLIVNRWSKENKGTIMGVILASNGIGAAIATQIVSPIIAKDTFGYQNAYRLIAMILLVVGILVMIFFKEYPNKGEKTADEVHKKKGRGRSWEGIEYSDAVKKAYFYGAMVCIFLTGMIIHGITGVATPHMYDVGLDAGFVATVVSCHAIALTCFKSLTGIMYDRFGIRTTANVCMITAVVVFFMLANVTNTATGMVLAMIYGIFSSLALPLETVMLPIYASDLFGEKSFEKILGLTVSINTAGYALGSPVSNLCYDLTGSYNVALYASCIVMVAVIVGINLVISASKKTQKNIKNASVSI